MKKNLRYLVLFLSIAILLAGTAVASNTQSNFGSVIVTEVDFSADDGSNIHSTLQRPVYATSSDPLPGVVVIHGSLQNKEWLMAFGIELARRGFVVLTVDANGHGNSDDGTGSGTAALEYIASLDYVNSSAIGMIGHSMGGGIAWRAINESSVQVNALVLVGSWASYANATYPNNLLVTVGSFDSLASYPRDLTLLEDAFGVTGITEGETYGSFDNGTARKIVIAPTNHLFETIDPIIVSESVEWMKDSLKGGIDDENWIPKEDLTYGYWLAGGFISLLGVILTIFPLLTILMALPFFEELNEEPSSDNPASEKTYTSYGLLYGLIGVGSFFPLLGLGFILPLPQNYAGSVVSWILGSALIAALVLYILMKKQNRLDGEWKGLWSVSGDASKRNTIVLKSVLLASIVITWLYAWTLLLDLGLALDFRCFLPGLNDLTAARAMMVPLYAAVFFVYSLVEGTWLMGILRTENSEPWYRGQTIWSLKAVFIKCIPYAFLISLQLGVGFIFGVPLVSGLIGFSFLFFYAFLLWFVVGAVIIVWCYRSTNSYYLGAIINGLIFGWLLASILSF
ncbi:MAG: alpha/beta hydrolase family protein [Candidatus Thorarchaeota archaeon]